MKAAAASKYETNPERLALMDQTINAIGDTSEANLFDGYSDSETLRKLADRLRVPYLYMQCGRLGAAEITEKDIGEYNAWRAAKPKGLARTKAKIRSFMAVNESPQNDELRDLALRLWLPYIEVHRQVYGILTVADVEEYNAWRTAAGRGTAPAMHS